MVPKKYKIQVICRLRRLKHFFCLSKTCPNRNFIQELKKSCGFDIVINIRLALRLRSVEVTQIDRRVEFWNVQNQLSIVY